MAKLFPVSIVTFFTVLLNIIMITRHHSQLGLVCTPALTLTCKLCMALPAASFVLKLTKAQNFSGNVRTLVTGPYLKKTDILC